MLTLKAKYLEGRVLFVYPVPFSGEQDVLVIFLSSEGKPTSSLDSEIQELKTFIRESGLGLTAKELEILQIAQSGKKIDEIAASKGISHGSARNQLSSVYSKLKVQNRTEAINKAIRLGLLDPIEGILD